MIKATVKKGIQWDVVSFVILTTIVPIIMFLVFYVYVSFDSVLMAFRDEDTMVYSFKYFQIFFNDLKKADSSILVSLGNTMRYFFLDNAIMFPLSVLFSFFLYKKIWGYKYFRIVFFLPSIISGVVLSTLYRYLLNGPISDYIQQIFMMDAPPLLFENPKYANTSIMVYVVWLGIAGNMIIHSGTLARIPTEIIESSKIDGAGFFREFINIAIPLIWPTLSTLLLMNIIGIFGASGPILLFTRGKAGTSTISYWIYECTVVSPQYNYAAAVGLVMTCVSIPIVLFSRWAMSKISTGEEF